jgi:hypothetical protein
MYGLCKDEFPYVWQGGDKPVENECEGRTESGPGGGIRCPVCGEWFCY